MPPRGRHRLNRAQVLMYLSAAGCRRDAAADLAGVHRSTFYRLMRLYGIAAPRPQWSLDPEDAPMIRTLLAAGLTQAQVAEKFEKNQSTISRIASREYWVKKYR